MELSWPNGGRTGSSRILPPTVSGDADSLTLACAYSSRVGSVPPRAAVGPHSHCSEEFV